MANVPSGLSLTTPQETKNLRKVKPYFFRYYPSIYLTRLMRTTVSKSVLKPVTFLANLLLLLLLYDLLLGLGRSFSFWCYTHSVGLLGRAINPPQGLYLHTEQHKHSIHTHTYIHSLSGIRTHDTSVSADAESSCLTASPRSYRAQAHRQTCVCPRGEEVHARKWKLYAATQDTALDRAAAVIGLTEEYNY
jgi:hypothetical protein